MRNVGRYVIERLHSKREHLARRFTNAHWCAMFVCDSASTATFVGCGHRAGFAALVEHGFIDACR